MKSFEKSQSVRGVRSKTWGVRSEAYAPVRSELIDFTKENFSKSAEIRGVRYIHHPIGVVYPYARTVGVRYGFAEGAFS